ncbi:thermonuclease family protein [Solidesulfovibrio alcoholivorans]|uniref:thermonuclease family protein n=1 Tax=Solidesulfovibrio alcoholivorans TaxID=81406 RepID=UPI0009FBF31F|nr:thermonuclease family protein [Solidesulfovibrio alcoholivorans]
MRRRLFATGRRGIRGGRFFVALLCACLLTPGLARAGGGEMVRVAQVFDGDTCRLADGRTVRLAGIDAPEGAHGGVPAQYFAAAAKAAFARRVMGRELRLVRAGQGGDRFGRVLGDFLLPDGASVAEALVADGAAFVFWHRDLPAALCDRLLAAARQAMATGRGFWPRLLALSPPARPYVGNAASRRFHDAACPQGRAISPRNRVAFPDLRAAFAAGFAPARECTPWPFAGGGEGASARSETDKP